MGPFLFSLTSIPPTLIINPATYEKIHPFRKRGKQKGGEALA
jgi:hypothetical protein